jgi:hypothetical protein
MIRLIGVIGFINGGKGTVASHLVNEYDFKQESFASSLKDACACIFDWPRDMLEGDTRKSREWREIVDPWWSEKLGIPDFSPRLALQVIGTNVLRSHFHEDLWFLTLQNRIRKNPNQCVVISDVRFPNEIKFIQDQGGILVRVRRGPEPEWYNTALLANKGDQSALDIMYNTYSSIHFSEWAWIGANIDYELNNNRDIESLQTQIKDLVDSIS